MTKEPPTTLVPNLPNDPAILKLEETRSMNTTLRDSATVCMSMLGWLASIIILHTGFGSCDGIFFCLPLLFSTLALIAILFSFWASEECLTNQLNFSINPQTTISKAHICMLVIRLLNYSSTILCILGFITLTSGVIGASLPHHIKP